MRKIALLPLMRPSPTNRKSVHRLLSLYCRFVCSAKRMWVSYHESVRGVKCKAAAKLVQIYDRPSLTCTLPRSRPAAGQYIPDRFQAIHPAASDGRRKG